MPKKKTIKSKTSDKSEKKTKQFPKENDPEIVSDGITEHYTLSKVPSQFSSISIRMHPQSFHNFCKRRQYIRTIRATDQFSTTPQRVTLKQFMRRINRVEIRKYLKFLKTADLCHSGNFRIRHAFTIAKYAESIKIRVVQLWNIGSPILDNEVYGLICSINKRTRGIHIHDCEFRNQSVKNILELYRKMSHKPLKEISYDQGIYWFGENQPKKNDFFAKIAESIARMTWLEYVKLSPLFYFLKEDFPVSKSLNRQKKLTAAVIARPSAREFEWAGGNVVQSDVSSEKFYQTFNNFANLTHLSIEIGNLSHILLKEVFKKSLKLKYIVLNLLDTQMSGKSRIPEGFEEALQQIGNLGGSLLEFKITHYFLLDEQPPAPPLFSIAPISSLVNLRKFTLETGSRVKRRLIDYGVLGEALGAMKNLAELRMFSYFSNDGFNRFLLSSSQKLTELEKIEWTFQFYQEIKIEESFEAWLKTKKKLKHFEFRLGTAIVMRSEHPVFYAPTLHNIANGIKQLTNLHYLRFCIGLNYGNENIFKALTNKNDKSLISNMLNELTELRKLAIFVGSTYLNDAELRRIIACVRKMRHLRTFGLSGDFKNIGQNPIYELMDFAENMKNDQRLKELAIIPMNYDLNKVENLTDWIKKFYGENTHYSIDDLEF